MLISGEQHVGTAWDLARPLFIAPCRPASMVPAPTENRKDDIYDGVIASRHLSCTGYELATRAWQDVLRVWSS